MPQRNRSPKSGQFSLGRKRFVQINAVGGIALTIAARLEFDEDDRLGLTAEQRRARIIDKYRR